MKLHIEDRVYIILAVMGAILIAFICESHAQCDTPNIRFLQNDGSPYMENPSLRAEWAYEQDDDLHNLVEEWYNLSGKEKHKVLCAFVKNSGYAILRQVTSQHVNYIEIIPENTDECLATLEDEGLLFRIQISGDDIQINNATLSPYVAFTGLHNTLVVQDYSDDYILWM